MKKILSIMAAISIAGPSAFSLIACSQKDDSKPDKPQDSETDVLDAGTVELENELKSTDLGTIGKSSAEEILAAVQFSNPMIAINELEVNLIGSNYAQIKPKQTSQVYTSTIVGVFVNFDVKVKQLLSNVVVNHYLGEIENSNVSTIKDALTKMNPDLNADEIEVIQPTIAKESAQVRANFNGIYRGTVVVNYVLLAKDLNEDLKVKNIGTILNNDKETLSNRLLELNPNLQLHEIEFVEITDHSFIVKGITNGNYYGQNSKVEGSFNLPQYLISEDLTGFNYQLGEIRDNTLQTIIAILKKQAPNLNTNEIVISHVTGDSFEIKAKTDGELYYRLEPPVKVNFTLPVKVSLSQISPFKWVTYRTRSEVETKIHNLILLNTKKTFVELNKDYEIIYVKKPLFDEVVPIQMLKVKAIASSPYLIGEFNLEIVAPLNLAHDRAAYQTVIRRQDDSELAVKKVLKDEIIKEMVRQNIDEDTENVISLIKIVPTGLTNGSTYYKYQHNSEYYYRQIVFSFLPNNLFGSNLITWTNVKAPLFYWFEVKDFDVKKDYSISYVDSTGDTAYPHNDTTYINSNHYPARNLQVYSKTITFSTFDVKTMFNYNSATEFFNNYSLWFNYDWGANNWTSSSKWKYGAGKDLKAKRDHWYNSNKTWSKYNPYDSNARAFTDGHVYYGNYDHYLGEDLGSGKKGFAAVHIWMEVKNTTIEIKGQGASAFDWNDGSPIDHAAFILFQGLDLWVSPK